MRSQSVPEKMGDVQYGPVAQRSATEEETGTEQGPSQN